MTGFIQRFLHIRRKDQIKVLPISAAVYILISALYQFIPNVGISQNTHVIWTVDGAIPADSLGLTLPHEHVFLDWREGERYQPSNWDNEHALAIILPFVQEMKVHGVKSFLECTPAFLGRNPRLLQKISKETGLQIITNTGFYAARKQVHIPGFVSALTVDQLSQLWIDEFNHGIEGTDIRPGFIKIGVDGKSSLDSLDHKIVLAAAKAHLQTGLTIVAHTGPDTTAMLQLAILEEEGVDPESFVWTHAQRGTGEGHITLARRGAWISLDGLGWAAPQGSDSTKLMQYVHQLENLRSGGLLHKVLLSHDAGWYTHGDSDQAGYKPYTTLFEHLIPTLNARGFTEADWLQIMVINPREAFSIKE